MQRTAERRVLRVDHVLFRAVDHGLVALDTRTGRCYRFNAVGALVWEVLDAARTPHAIVTAVRDRTAGDPATLERDVEAFLAVLAEHSLIRTELPA